MFVHGYGHFSNTFSKGNLGGLIDLTKYLFSIPWDDAKVDATDPNMLNHFVNGLYEVLNPIIAMLGKFVAQQLVKTCSGKIHPIIKVLISIPLIVLVFF